MPLANNQRDQLGDRLEADIKLREPGFTVTRDVGATGEPIFLVDSGSGVDAAFAISKRTFDGFNVVAELSSSAAEGLPEHITWVAVDTGASQILSMKYMQMAVDVGASSVKVAFEATIDKDSVLDDALVAAELPANARTGASGQ
jgi:hypothetical protein